MGKMGVRNFDIVKHLNKRQVSGGMLLEINYGSWFGNRDKYDIRKWTQDHKGCDKGITLTKEEARALKEMFAEIEI